MYGTRAHADHSRSCSAFPRECNLDAQRPQESLRPPHPAGERSRRFWPTGASLPKLVTGKIGCLQKVCGASRPRASLGHKSSYPCRYRICLYHAFDRGSAVCRIGARVPRALAEEGFRTLFSRMHAP